MRPPSRRALGIFAAAFIAPVLLFAGTAVLDLSERCIPSCRPNDPNLYVWMFRWMAYAISHRIDPFSSPLIGAPEGTPFYWITSVAAPAFVGLPLTFTLGAQAAYNVLVLLSVGFSVWAVYLFCFEVSSDHRAACAGAGLFLVSSYVTFELEHLNLLSVGPVALFAWLVLRFVRRRVGLLGLVLGGGAVLAFEFMTSTEVFATMTLFGGLVVLLHLAMGLATGERRGFLARLLPGVAGAYLVCALLVAPFLRNILRSQPAEISIAASERSIDVLEVAIPGDYQVLGAWMRDLRPWAGIEAGDGQRGQQGYLGIPVLLLLIAVFRDRSRYPAILLPFIVGSVVLSFGPSMELFRDVRIPGPYSLLAGLPLLEHAYPKRFALYTWLGCSVALTLWVAGRPKADRTRVGLWLVIGALTLFPATSRLAPPPKVSAAALPRLFVEDDFRWFITPDDVVLALGGISDELRWHVAADLGFRLAEGYLGPYTPWGMAPLTSGSPPPGGAPAVAGLLARRQVDWVALPTGTPSRWRPLLLEVSGEPPISYGGIDLYRVSDDAGSGPASLAPSALDAYRRGVAAQVSGRLTDAAAAFRAVLALEPTSAAAHLRMAQIYLDYRDLHLAEVHLRAALASEPASVGALVELAHLWDAAGRRDAAGALYRRAYLLRPSALTEPERLRAEALLAGAMVSP